MKQDEKVAYAKETARTAKLLGLPSYGPGADKAIVNYCRSQVAQLVAEHGLPPTVDGLLRRVALCLEVEFVEIHDDEDLQHLLKKIPPSVEPLMARVKDELNEETDAITIRRLNPRPYERRYLAVINCQSEHYFRRFFSKWHELGHRLIDGEQLMIAFRKTSSDRKDPGEVLVDKVAGELAFFSDIVAPKAKRLLRESGPTFKAVESLRKSVARDASRQASALALMRHAKGPAWYIRCALSLKPSEARRKSLPGNEKVFVPTLRVQEVHSNEMAVQSGVRIHRWMRIPMSSHIRRAYATGEDLTGIERLDDWETSEGGSIGSIPILIDTRNFGNEVAALVSAAGR